MLSSPDQRAAYDRLGAAGVTGTPLMDPGVLFSAMFGSDVFEDYVGKRMRCRWVGGSPLLVSERCHAEVPEAWLGGRQGREAEQDSKPCIRARSSGAAHALLAYRTSC